MTNAGKQQPRDLDPDLLKVLACPKCKGDLELVDDAAGLACGACRLRFPIEDGIPVMLLSEAQPTG